MTTGSRHADELVEARRRRMAGRQHARGDDGVVRRVLVREARTETRLHQRAVDALPLGLREHRRREVEPSSDRESALAERSAEQPRAGAGVEDPGVQPEACVRRPPRPPPERGSRLAREVVVVDSSDPLVLGAQLVEVARAVEAVDIDPPVGDG